MNIFRKKYMICKECGVHFEPHDDRDNNFIEFCSTHRKPKLELLFRKRKVVSWAEQNWEKLESEVLKAEKELHEAYRGCQAMSQKQLESMASQQYIGSLNTSGSIGLSLTGNHIK